MAQRRNHAAHSSPPSTWPLTYITNLHLFLSAILFVTSQLITVGAEVAEPQPKYSWDRNHKSTSATLSMSPTLIIQSLPHGPEEQLLDITSRVNRAYAKRWGFDYLSYVGSDSDSYLLRNSIMKKNGTDGPKAALTPKSDTNGTEPNASNTDGANNSGYGSDSFTKPFYETVMFLKSDSIIVQFDYNILNLIRKESLVGCGVDGEWHVFSDVMIWNVNHPLFNNVTDSWLEMDEASEIRPTGSGNRRTLRGEDTDSLGTPGIYNLATLLMDMEKEGIDSGVVVDKIPKELVNGLDGTVIKQYEEEASKQDLTNDLPKIIPLIQSISDNTCYRYYPQCELVYF